MKIKVLIFFFFLLLLVFVLMYFAYGSVLSGIPGSGSNLSLF